MPPSRRMTFVYGGEAPDIERAVLSRLTADAGVQFGPSDVAIRSLLDTFDGRLHRAGLRAEARSGRPTGPFEVVLAGPAGDAAAIVVPGPIPAVDDLPGPVGDRLATVAPSRTLEPRVSVVAPIRSGPLRDADGNTVAIVSVFGEGRWFAGGLRHQRRGGLPSPVAVELRLLVDRRQPIKPVIRCLTDLGAVPIGGDLLDQALGACAVDPRGLVTTPSIELSTELSATEGVCRQLAHLTGTIDATWQGTAEARDVEYLHEFRIAVRRSRSVMGAFRHVLPDSLVDHGRSLFALLGELTGPARDLDVIVLGWPALTAEVEPEGRVGLDLLREALDAARTQAHRRLADGLRAAPTRRRMEAWRGHLVTGVPTPEAGTIGDAVEDRIRLAHRRLVSHGRAISDASPAEELHELRKDAKKLGT